MRLILALCGLLVWTATDTAWAQSTEAEINTVADAVRSEGHPCEAPYQVERDTGASSPNVAVWTMSCTGGRYRVTFDGDASVEVVPLGP